MTQSITYPGSQNVYYEYDLTGRLKKMCDDSDCSGETYYAIDPASAYDQYGNLLSESYGNGVQTAFAYYPLSHRLSGETIAKGSTQYSSRSFAFDSHSNITSISDPLGSTSSSALSSVTYDSLDRMTAYTSASSAAEKTLSYDSLGNMLTNTNSYSNTYQYSSSRPNAVTQIGSETFGYDDNGNMTSDGSRTMTYNALNQLKSVTMTNGSVSNYDYDYSGNRVSKTVTSISPALVTTTATTYYLGDSLEIRGDRVILNLYANGKKIVTKSLGLTSAIGTLSADDYFYYHHGDHLGSSHIITEGNALSDIHSGITYNRGDLIQRYEYSPFGQETYVLNPNLDLDPSYTGQVYDQDSGLYYYKARYYNPVLGRFIQPDTVIPDATNLQAYNRYSYVSNNPLKYTDPSGHSWIGNFFKGIINIFSGGGGGGGSTGGVNLGMIFGGVGSTPTAGNRGDEIPTARYIGPGSESQGEAVIENIVIPTPALYGESIPGGLVAYEGDPYQPVEIPILVNISNYIYDRGVQNFGKGHYLAGVIDFAGFALLPTTRNDLFMGVMFPGSSLEGSAEKAIIIGEGMAAVKTVAKENGAKWYQAWSKYFRPESFNLEESLGRNAEWIESKIKGGYKIYDIGIDPSRVGGAARSPFYQMEKDIIEQYNYPTTPLPRP